MEPTRLPPTGLPCVPPAWPVLPCRAGPGSSGVPLWQCHIHSQRQPRCLGLLEALRAPGGSVSVPACPGAAASIPKPCLIFCILHWCLQALVGKGRKERDAGMKETQCAAPQLAVWSPRDLASAQPSQPSSSLRCPLNHGPAKPKPRSWNTAIPGEGCLPHFVVVSAKGTESKGCDLWMRTLSTLQLALGHPAGGAEALKHQICAAFGL